ncbi:biotin--[acetyl-CoA-carboxylase] ligase [Spiribacter salinus]|uniref:biotin--[acetyl-CoA-carboxylase] ligase n=1 Tax=Spiribacter salinus TaxID=1335746 RepID=UPI001C93AF42|nr:biotin--[acetyl-CoA-carboxylase] ligase [Spiribacter salinus]MBY5268823.1 biotin--[acetyl-CoA-carboxylase] ligase [Spiribacter salinus]
MTTQDTLAAVQAGLGPRHAQTAIHVFESLPSTNEWLGVQSLAGPTLVTARTQTQGRGRRGRAWASPAGGWYFSVGVPLSPDDPVQPTVTLQVGLALAEALSSAGFPGIAVKWPNDLVINGAKLGGILVERLPTALIVGVGINRSTSAIEHLPADRRAIGLNDLGDRPTHEELIGQLAAAILDAVKRSPDAAAAILDARWPARDALTGHTVVVAQSDDARDGTGTPLQGEVLGITPNGQLRLATASGEQWLNAGECRIQGGWEATA